VARVIGAKLAEKWGQSVIIENRSGAGGNIAADVATKATPDGYTLLFANNGIVISPMLYHNLSYRVLRDLEPISQVTAMPHVLVTSQVNQDNSLSDLIKSAKGNPHRLTFASSGTGATDHMAGELLKYMAKIEIDHVPYKGGPPALADTVSGQVTMYFAGLPSAMPLVNAGKVKALGTTGAKRSAAMPNVPTIAEANLPGYAVINWYGFFAPAGTPRNLVDKIALDVNRVLHVPSVRARFDELGIETVGSSPDQFAEFIKLEFGIWGKVIEAANIKAD
ncbi:MAG: tripartite tricarboxylate transporter substrate binding protein, partial [Burkholderiales bacterium]